jgi:DNA-binding response OmpR family regulator
MEEGKVNRQSRVLAIDDDESILDIVKTCLEAEGFAVETKNDPRDGVKWYAQRWAEVDLVLLDYMMPGMKGDEVFHHVRQVNPQAKVMMLSGSDAPVANLLLAQGLKGYIHKPFYLNQLVKRIRDAITSP